MATATIHKNVMGLAVALVEAVEVQIGPADQTLLQICRDAAARIAATLGWAR